MEEIKVIVFVKDLLEKGDMSLLKASMPHLPDQLSHSNVENKFQ